MNISPSSSHTIVIIGGVAGGASAAARARRHSETAEIILLERGPDVSFANCGLTYHIGGEIADRAELAIQTPQSLRALLRLTCAHSPRPLPLTVQKKPLLSAT